MTRPKNFMQDFLVLILLPAIAGLAMLIAFFAESAAQADSEELVADLQRTRSLAKEIAKFRNSPVIAGAADIDTSDIARRIDQAAKSALFPSDAITRISPELPQRIADTPYRQRVTQVTFRNINLRQLLSFATAISRPDGGMNIKSIRIVAPRIDAAPSTETWAVEITLTYIYFDPGKDSA